MAGLFCLVSCAKKERTEAPKPEAPAAQPGGGPHAVVHLKDGSNVLRTIVASSATDMIVAGDDGIERKISMAQVKSVEHGDAQPARQVPRERAPANTAADRGPAPAPVTAPPVATTRTYELPVGSEVSVRTNEAIDSDTAAEGQKFGA